MSKVFFGGSRKLSRLNSEIRTELRKLIAYEHTVLIGDANGADKVAQTFFADEGYRNVIVYCMDGEYRNNIGKWKIRPVDSKGEKNGFKRFTIQDAEMSRDADYGFMLWDGKSKGTLNNVVLLLEQQKPTRIYFSPSKSFMWVKSTADLKSLIEKFDPDEKFYFDKTIKLSERIQPQWLDSG